MNGIMDIHRYRVHLIITAAELDRPESFRVDTFAAGFDQAVEAATEWLDAQPLTDARVLTVASTERVSPPK